MTAAGNTSRLNANFATVRGYKRYELANHLGNVLVTITDRRLRSCADGAPITADIIQAQDYYPFGSLMPGRIYEKAGNPKDYRFGFNGQEYTDELAGKGNHTTAEFWEYDARIGRRWNLDPKPLESESQYAVNRNNPIWFNDPNGDLPIIPVAVYYACAVAFGVSFGVDYGTQVVLNKLDNSQNPYTDISWKSCLISGGAGVLTAGSGAAVGVLVKSPRLINAAKIAAEVTIQTGESVAKQAIDEKNTEGITLSKTFWDVAGAQAGGKLADKVETKLIDIAPLQHQADHFAQTAANSTRNTSRAATQANKAAGAKARVWLAKQANNFFTANNLAKGEAFENMFQTIADKSKTPKGHYVKVTSK